MKKAWGVFDSGLGGLTVLKSLATQFPNEDFIYIGDTARVPYGGKSPATIKHYSHQILQELESKNTKGLIVACNTASAQLPEPHFNNLPLFKVIQPGCQAALQATKNKKIGIIGTRATIESKAYEITLKSIDSSVDVISLACPLFVPFVEEGWIDDPLTNIMVFRYLQPLVSTGIDTLILGCTHYPILHASIQKVMGNHVGLVESGKSLGDQMLASWPELSKSTASSDRKIEILLTDFSSRSESLARQFLHPVVPTVVTGHLL